MELTTSCSGLGAVTQRFTVCKVRSMKSAKSAITAAKNVILFPLTRARGEQDEVAFLPAALEIVERPPSPLGRAIDLTVAALFSLALIWSIIGKVDIIAYATGKVVPSGRIKL